LRQENERLKRQLELLSSQTRRVHSQIWTTDKIAEAHADLLKTALRGMAVVKGFTRYCQVLDHPIVDCLARCLDDEDFVCQLAKNVKDLVGTQNCSTDEVYDQAAPIYAQTLAECLRIDFVRRKLRARGIVRELIKSFFDALFTLEPDDYGKQTKLREYLTECLVLLHCGDAERQSSQIIYGGVNEMAQKIAFFINHDEISEMQRANMLKVFILITPDDQRQTLSNDLNMEKFKPTARDPRLVKTFNALETSFKTD